MMLNELPGTTIQYRPALRAKERTHRNLDKITHIVLHETGVGIYKREQKLGTSDGLELALYVYEKIMPYSAHYVVGPTGTPAQTLSMTQIAQHVGSTNTRAYRRLDDAKQVATIPQWWRSRSKDHPNQVPSLVEAWKLGSVNACSIGIEIVPPRTRGEALPGVQVQSVAYMIDLICKAVPSIRYITSHCLVHPLSRTTVSGKPYDMTLTRYQQICDNLTNGLQRKAV